MCWPASRDCIAGSSIAPSRFFKWSQAQILFFKCIGSKLCSWAALLKSWFQSSNWPHTQKFSQLLDRQGWHLLLTFLTMVMLYAQFLCSDWSKFDQICAASGKLFTDSWSWQSFESSCHIFKCLFPLDVQNEYGYSLDSSVIHSWFVYWNCGWEMSGLTKSS